MTSINRQHIFLIVALVVLCYFPLFHHLDRLSIRQWDESRLAVSALEMTQSGNLLITTFEEVPDMWNTKPPLMIWLQATFMKVIGFNELAVRLPSALAGLATLALLFVFFSRSLARSDIASIAVLVLISCAGYATVHVTRTGDYDALLTLFTTATIFFTFAWLDAKKDQFLFWITISVIGMGLTKGVQGFMIFPGLLLYILIKGEFLGVIKNKNFWRSALVAISAIIGFYLLREFANPGYLSTVWETELGGRFQRDSDFHAQPFLFYIKELTLNYFPYWKYFLPLGLVFGLTSSDTKIQNISQLLLISSVTYLLLISSSKTKLWWYQTPLLPLFAAIVGIGIAEFIHWIQHRINVERKTTKIGMTVLAFILLGFYPYRNKIIEVHAPLEKERMNWKRHKMGECWQQLDNIDQLNVVITTYNAQAIYYVKAAAINNNRIQYFDSISELPINEKALLCDDGAKQRLRDLFEIEMIQECGYCEIAQVLRSVK